MIDATIFALLVGAVATPISWWGLNRFGCSARSAGARARRENRPVAPPGQAVGARRVGRRHAVLVAGLFERVAADPRLPAAGAVADDRVLHARALVACEHRRRPRLGERGEHAS